MPPAPLLRRRDVPSPLPICPEGAEILAVVSGDDLPRGLTLALPGLEKARGERRVGPALGSSPASPPLQAPSFQPQPGSSTAAPEPRGRDGAGGGGTRAERGRAGWDAAGGARLCLFVLGPPRLSLFGLGAALIDWETLPGGEADKCRREGRV